MLTNLEKYDKLALKISSNLSSDWIPQDLIPHTIERR